MSDNRTTELRRLLTERGIEYATDDRMGVCETSWNGFTAMQLTPNAKLTMVLTPEQAVAATLGRPTFNANLEQALSFMRIWISDDAHLGESELSAAFEKAEGLRKLDAIENAIAATLGNTTCEYVIEDNMNESEGMGDVWFRCTNCDMCFDYADDWLLKMPHCPKCGATVKGVR